MRVSVGRRMSRLRLWKCDPLSACGATRIWLISGGMDVARGMPSLSGRSSGTSRIVEVTLGCLIPAIAGCCFRMLTKPQSARSSSQMATQECMLHQGPLCKLPLAAYEEQKRPSPSIVQTEGQVTWQSAYAARRGTRQGLGHHGRAIQRVRFCKGHSVVEARPVHSWFPRLRRSWPVRHTLSLAQGWPEREQGHAWQSRASTAKQRMSAAGCQLHG